MAHHTLRCTAKAYLSQDNTADAISWLKQVCQRVRADDYCKLSVATCCVCFVVHGTACLHVTQGLEKCGSADAAVLHFSLGSAYRQKGSFVFTVVRYHYSNEPVELRPSLSVVIAEGFAYRDVLFGVSLLLFGNS